MSVAPRSLRLLDTLYPALKEAWLVVAADLLKSHGVQIQVANEGALRTWAEQAKLYAQGRTAPGPIVTKSPPGTSWHNFGLGVDSIFDGGDPYLERAIAAAKARADLEALKAARARFNLLWNAYGRSVQKVGLVWGADWDSDGNIAEHSLVDRPHMQLTFGMSLKTARALHEKGGLWSVWARCDELRATSR
jgi:peptidoglycan LD-endopeptidase CwlK